MPFILEMCIRDSHNSGERTVFEAPVVENVFLHFCLPFLFLVKSVVSNGLLAPAPLFQHPDGEEVKNDADA